MQKEIEIDGRTVRFKTSAALPYLYRHRFGRDLMIELAQLTEHYKKAREGGDPLGIDDLELFERIAYIMAYHAEPATVPDSMESWLEGYETFDIYEVLPELMELWEKNLRTTSTPKKK